MEASDLYGLPLERFVAERNALAKTLRRAGRGSEATRVGALRKPSVAAWAVNQLVRTQVHAVSILFESGDQLRRAHSELLAGRGNADELREAAAKVRAALDELAAAARGLLSSGGHELTPATLERVNDTLYAAALEEDARDLVRDGCLERELRHVGIGMVGDQQAPPARRRIDPEQGAREQAARARADERGAARKAEADTRRVAERARRELDSAQARRDRAAAALQDAEEALAGARERAEQASLAHRRAQQALEDL